MSMQRSGRFRDGAGGSMMFGATYEEVALEITLGLAGAQPRLAVLGI